MAGNDDQSSRTARWCLLNASGLPAIELSAEHIRAWITDAKSMTAKTGATRKPEMKAYTLVKGDVDALAAYLATLKKK